MPLFLSLLLAFALMILPAGGQVVINEIHYHPVEKPRFDANGVSVYSDAPTIVADISDDVHEFVELRNAGAASVDIAGWKLGGVDFTFAAGTSIPPDGYLVIAKNPARIQSVYAITGVLGPYSGKLGNGGDTIELINPSGTIVDSVSYEARFPWAISANALGADDDFTGLDSTAYQYKGRSLQRVSDTASSNDPANWVALRAAGALPFADLPTPGAANIVTRPAPKPVVVAYSAVRSTDNAPVIRAGVSVKVTCTFSGTDSLSNAQVEYFLDNMNAFGEARLTVAMTALGNNQYAATLPGQIDRTIVRYRIKADRGDGVEVVAPRADDPAVVQTGGPTYTGSPLKKNPAPREPWYAYFVTPARTSLKPIIDIIVPTDNSVVDDNASTNTTAFNGINGFQSMGYNCKGSPKRTTAENTANSYPRETPYVPVTDRLWNDVVPAIFASNGVIYDIQVRFHGSRWNRRPSRKSFKVFFPEYQPYKDGAGNLVSSIFETDKSDFFLTAHGLHQRAGLPLSTVRWVDWYFNNDSAIPRVEQGEYDDELLTSYFEKLQRLNPGSVKEANGEYYKSGGYIVSSNATGEGPYGNGNEWLLPAAGFWTELQRYDYTYALQNHAWKGAAPVRDMIKGMWAARGDTYTSPNPKLANLKAWLQANWDIDTELTSMALGNWMTPWDDTTQNHFLYRRANGKWFRVLWDFDAMYGTGDSTGSGSSIYLGEQGLPSAFPGNNFRGPNYVKDSFIKAFRKEYNLRLWFLNNTLLDPENLQTLTYPTSSGGSATYYSFINAQNGGFASARFTAVNSQVNSNTQPAPGIFYKPRRPAHTAPSNASAVLPGANLTASAYLYDAASTHTAAPLPSPHTSSKWEIRAANSNYDYPVAVITSSSSKTSLPIPFAQLDFGQTYYWRVTYYDADAHPSVTSAETSFSFGPTSTTAGSISLNEIMADNRRAILNGGSYPDYVELRNNTGAVIDISNWSLSNDDSLPNKYLIPAGTTVPANGYLVIWCDSETLAPGLHSGFGIGASGDRILLSQNGVVRDVVAFGPQAPDLSIGRLVDGTGTWTLNTASPGSTNVGKTPLGSIATLKLNEWMADPLTGSDWFELYNPDPNPVALAGLYLSDTPGTPNITQIPALSFIGGEGFTKFVADSSTAGFQHVNFSLKAGGESIILSNSNGITAIDSVTFGAQDTNVSAGRFPNGAPTPAGTPPSWTRFPQSGSPGESNFLPASIVINEALSASTLPLSDTIELYNPTANAVDIGNWWLSDDKSFPKKYRIAAGTTIAAGGYKVFTELDFNAAPGTEGSFSLSSFGDEIVLSAVDGAGVMTGFQSEVSFGAATDGVSFGRIAKANGFEFWPLITRTFGAINAPPKNGPLIINEIMYHPPDLGTFDNVRDEFVELHNVTTTPVDLTGWKLRGDADFVFPAGSSILPGDYILLVGFDPADAPTLAAFRNNYALGQNTSIFGPFTPKLANSTANIELAYPDAAIGGIVPYIRVDKVEYSQVAPWPVTPDGTGPSLQRLSRAVIGNDAANWAAASPTPGKVNSGESAIADSDGDGIPDAWENASGLNPLFAGDAAQDVDGDGQSNVAEYLAATDPRNGNDVFQTEITRAPSGFTLRFTARANHSYTIQFKNALSDGVWQRLADFPAQPADRVEEQIDTSAPASRFYRVITPQQAP
ncbi:MAG: Spore coat protein CotH [Chthoniobacteraceae bacterium]|nr:Spore coat protein CotH [Chthoniobacteraceae bacterium]